MLLITSLGLGWGAEVEGSHFSASDVFPAVLDCHLSVNDCLGNTAAILGCRFGLCSGTRLHLDLHPAKTGTSSNVKHASL